MSKSKERNSLADFVELPPISVIIPSDKFQGIVSPTVNYQQTLHAVNGVEASSNGDSNTRESGFNSSEGVCDVDSGQQKKQSIISSGRSSTSYRSIVQDMAKTEDQHSPELPDFPRKEEYRVYPYNYQKNAASRFADYDITKDFNIEKILGTGAYGKVFMVRKKSGCDANKLYAMKVLKKSAMANREKVLEHTKNERLILESVKNLSFIVNLHYAFQTADKLHLIIDYVSGGELFSLLCRENQFTESETRFYVGEIILALEHCHKKKIIYRDIKLENILIDKNGHIVLTDFGLSKQFQPHDDNRPVRAYSFCGTIEYMAPEVIRNENGYDSAVDWWGVGVITYELLTGLSPFAPELNMRHGSSLITNRILKMEPVYPHCMGVEMKNFIQRLLLKNPTERLGSGGKGADELKEHCWFTKDCFDWEALSSRKVKPPHVPALVNELDTSNFSGDTNKVFAANLENGAKFLTFEKYSYVSPSIMAEEKNRKEDPVESPMSPVQDLLTRVSAFDGFLNYHEPPFFLDYEIGPEILGEGSFSVVRKCKNRKTKENYAVKIMHKTDDYSREIAMLQRCQGHPNVVELIKVYEDFQYAYIVMELLEGGELLAPKNAERIGNENRASEIIKQLASALMYIHQRNVIHKDIKPENILFKSDGIDDEIKIVDFGFAHMNSTKENTRKPCFSLPYAAPEIISKNPVYDERIDVWGIGAVMYALVSGETSREINSKSDLGYRISYKEIDFDSPRFTDNLSSECIDVLKSLLQNKPQDRTQLYDLMQHPWIQRLNVVELNEDAEEDVAEDASEGSEEDLNEDPYEGPEEDLAEDSSHEGLEEDLVVDASEGSEDDLEEVSEDGLEEGSEQNVAENSVNSFRSETSSISTKNHNNSPSNASSVNYDVEPMDVDLEENEDISGSVARHIDGISPIAKPEEGSAIQWQAPYDIHYDRVPAIENVIEVPYEEEQSEPTNEQVNLKRKHSDSVEFIGEVETRPHKSARRRLNFHDLPPYSHTFVRRNRCRLYYPCPNNHESISRLSSTSSSLTSPPPKYKSKVRRRKARKVEPEHEVITVD